MIETGNLSEINTFRKRSLSECPDKEIASLVSEHSDDFTDIHFLLTETTRFYTEKFSELQKYIKREKRLLVFETPSRVAFTHEYTVEGAGNVKSGFHFLFNTTERLSWLKIEMEGRRVSIASKGRIVSLLIERIGKEIKMLADILHEDESPVGLRLYNASDGKPCFVEYNHNDQKGQQSLLFCATFFDSIRNKVQLTCNRWWSPLQEKCIKYNYSTISSNANAWIYIKAPANFVLSVSHNAAEGFYEESMSNDDEIRSYVLKPNDEPLSVDFSISIDVPQALKVWYNGMLYLSVVIAMIGVFALGFSLINTAPAKMVETYYNCTYAVIAALIATRGWLMAEEQVMKQMSNCYTGLIAILIAVVLGLALINGLS